MDAEDDSAHPGHGLVEEMRTWSTSATTKDCASASEYEERTALLKEGRRGGSTGA